ncbi:Short-chain dehydrogenase [Nannocystis exedens]|uniref:Short-chain dehydrogenase n=1 Tax=Nannocystis exedens TaxID=54 RepID=A0A1I2E3D5_9BACT|nr:SDR family NAD(P)-dependent oxidoreductase [Nannocystis exedens]PCC69223.1 short-chain dehydrogenase/reductase [Nannocystis exedens]SFE86730.1 Short-chain dehydrogenase [Nannocystis exedens]
MTLDRSPTPVALVTGASSGVGAVTASALVRRGWRVFGTSRHDNAGPPGVAMLTLDVDDDASVSACAAELSRRAGALDVLVNNAGRAMVGACEETGADEARALFETNVFGVMRVVSALLPMMRGRRRGHIVNIGSLSGFVGVPFHGVYAASKHALAGYSEALRVELAPFGVAVSLIEPAAHRTAIAMSRPRTPMAVYDQGRAHVEAIIRGQIDRGASPERIAAAVVAAVSSPRPPFRLRVGGKATYAAWGRRLLPSRAFEALIRHEFGLPAATP